MQSLEKQKIEWSEKISALNTNLNSAKSEIEIKVILQNYVFVKTN